MTTEINQKIAEFCGWRKGKKSVLGSWIAPDNLYDNLPDYTTDRNALAEAMGKLSEEQKGQFRKKLNDAYWEDRPMYWTNLTDWILFACPTETMARCLSEVI